MTGDVIYTFDLSPVLILCELDVDILGLVAEVLILVVYDLVLVYEDDLFSS